MYQSKSTGFKKRPIDHTSAIVMTNLIEVRYELLEVFSDFYDLIPRDSHRSPN